MNTKTETPVRRGDNPRIEHYDVPRGNVLGIAVTAAPDAMTFWDLVAADGDVARAQQTIQPPTWGWYRWAEDTNGDFTFAVRAVEGDEGAFYGALIALKLGADQ